MHYWYFIRIWSVLKIKAKDCSRLSRWEKQKSNQTVTAILELKISSNWSTELDSTVTDLGGKSQKAKPKKLKIHLFKIVQCIEKIDKNIFGPNFFDPKLTRPKLFSNWANPATCVSSELLRACFSTSLPLPLSEKRVMEVSWVELSLVLIHCGLKDFQPKNFFLIGVCLNDQIMAIWGEEEWM